MDYDIQMQLSKFRQKYTSTFEQCLTKNHFKGIPRHAPKSAIQRNNEKFTWPSCPMGGTPTAIPKKASSNYLELIDTTNHVVECIMECIQVEDEHLKMHVYQESVSFLDVLLDKLFMDTGKLLDGREGTLEHHLYVV